jgi:hypothetical protein
LRRLPIELASIFLWRDGDRLGRAHCRMLPIGVDRCVSPDQLPNKRSATVRPGFSWTQRY